ncbi:hypothetical protein L6475_09155 [Prevotella sp. E9-3]|uniref:hypothetical protein n=1 Tax=Prevotella sp. E9-3 TaxID=2913621 RepID=UPI001EDB8FAB|nr:hypothetical protein [Prevotella sp. E9-3]UKK47389.1 hypothetical protein L6475_09155 [Prevotella sp. E9-3]
MQKHRLITFLLALLVMAWAPAYAQKPLSSKTLTKEEQKKQIKAERKRKKQEEQKKLLLPKPGDSSMTSAKKDTAEVEDNPFAVKMDASYVPVDSMRLKGVVNPDTFIMDRRYIAEGDTLTYHWYDNLSVQSGAGAEQMVPPPGKNNYHFDPLTTVHVGVGYQLGKYHSLRLVGHAALGYQKDYDRMFARYGLKVDHLFDLSSYFSGYNPMRLLSVQTVIGTGFQHAMLNNAAGLKGDAFEGHAGLQLHFNTGPHGSFNIEPYFGLGGNNYDLSHDKNWRKVDVFYGVNANFVHYFTNHLTRAARLRQREKARNTHNRLMADSITLQSWQAPWIVELAAGPFMMKAPVLSLTETMGHEEALSVGKWFSPVVGMRVSGLVRSAMWQKVYESTDGISYERAMYTHSYGARVEAMLNPLGFTNNYVWDRSFGFYLVGGLEYGKYLKYQTREMLSCSSEGYVAGLHLWMRLADGLHLFVEPRFVHNVYKIPYRNVHWNARYSDNGYGLNIGLTATSQSRKYRLPVNDSEADKFRRVSIGVGGGYNLIHICEQYLGDKGKCFNLNSFAQYSFDHVSSVRAGFEFVVHSKSNIASYYDGILDENGYANYVTKRKGQWNHTYNMGIATLAYSANMGNLLRGYRPGRLFELDLFVGPALFWRLSEEAKLSELEMLRDGHILSLPKDKSRAFRPAAHGGAKLVANITPKIGITLTPQIFYLSKFNMSAILPTRVQVIETLDLGVQYKF